MWKCESQDSGGSVWLGRVGLGSGGGQVGSGPRGLGGTDDIVVPYHAASQLPPRAERVAGRGGGWGAPLAPRERLHPTPTTFASRTRSTLPFQGRVKRRVNRTAPSCRRRPGSRHR